MVTYKKQTRFDVEKIFNEFIPQINGELGGKLTPTTDNQLNADYVFKDPEVIVELKCFQKDLFSIEDDSERMDFLFKKWASKGIFDDLREVRKMLISRKLPKECAEDLFKAARNSVDSVIRKANKQIRETKKCLNMPNAKAFLLLCNDGHYYLQHLQFMHLIGDIVFNKYKDIDGFTYFTINHISNFPDSDSNQHVWLPIFRQDDKVLTSFSEKMRSTFLTEFMPKHAGWSNAIIDSTGNELEGYETIAKMQYKKKNTGRL